MKEKENLPTLQGIEQVANQLQINQDNLIECIKNLQEQKDQNIVETVRREKEILEDSNGVVAKFTENLRQAQDQLEIDNERLRRITNYLHRQEQLELELYEAYKTQITATDQAQDRFNQAQQQVREIEQATDTAIQQQQQTEDTIERLTNSLSADESKLTWLKGTLAASFLSPIAGAIVAIPMINKISACKTDINEWKAQLNTAKKRFSQIAVERDRVLDAQGEVYMEQLLAYRNLRNERENLEICKTNWENQKSVINVAKLAVNEQNVRITNVSEQMKKIQYQLDAAREDQLQEIIKVNRIEGQMNTLSIQQTQLFKHKK